MHLRTSSSLGPLLASRLVLHLPLVTLLSRAGRLRCRFSRTSSCKCAAGLAAAGCAQAGGGTTRLPHSGRVPACRTCNQSLISRLASGCRGGTGTGPSSSGATAGAAAGEATLKLSGAGLPWCLCCAAHRGLPCLGRHGCSRPTRVRQTHSLLRGQIGGFRKVKQACLSAADHVRLQDSKQAPDGASTFQSGVAQQKAWI